MDESAGEPDWDVFVSYARHDVDEAMALAELLRTHDLRVFLDESGVRACTSIPKSIRKALSSSRLLIALYSHTYPTRPACMWELDAALRNGLHEKDPHRRVLVINPEKDAAHIEIPVLHDTRHWDAPTSSTDNSVLLMEVMEHLSNLSDSMGLPPKSGSPELPSAGFTGRFPQLWKLHANACAAIEVLGIEPHPRGAQVIGLPGVGKSALINAYAADWGAFYEQGIHWHRESLPDTWHEGLTIVEDLSPDHEGQIHEWLNRRPANSAVIVSGRVPLDIPLASVRLGSLEVDGAGALLRSYRQPRSEAEDRAAHKLALQVGGHPQTLHVVGQLLSQTETTTPFTEVCRQWHRLDVDEVGRFAKRLRQLPGGYSANFVTSLQEALPEPCSAEFDLLRALAARPEMVSQPEMAYRILAVLGHRVDGDEVLSNLHARGIVEHSHVVPVIGRIATRYDPDPTRRAEVADLMLAANRRLFNQRKATGVGGIMPSAKERKIAFTLQVELSTRITSIELGNDEGVLSEALESLLSVLRQSREAMADLGATGHTGQTYQLLKQVIDTLHPVLRKWHPRLLDHQSVRPDGVGLVTHEREWVQADELRSELEQLRQPLSEIQSSLRRISGTEL